MILIFHILIFNWCSFVGIFDNKLFISFDFRFCGTIEYMAPEILTRNGHGKAVGRLKSNFSHFLNFKDLINNVVFFQIGGRLEPSCTTC